MENWQSFISHITSVVKQYNVSLNRKEIEHVFMLEALFYFRYRHHIEITIDETRNLLLGLHKIGKSDFTNFHFELDNVRRNFRVIAGGMCFRRTVQLYRQLPNELKLFDDIHNLDHCQENIDFKKSRIECYQNSFRNTWKEKIKIPKSVSNETKYFFNNKTLSAERYNLKIQPLQPEKNRKGGTIRIKIADLKIAAKEMDEKMISHSELADENYESRMDHFTVLLYDQYNITEVDYIMIKDVCNIVGMVGAGKSTLIQVLTYWLAKNNYRVTVVSDKVKDVLDQTYLFEQLGVSCTAINGLSNHQNRVQKVIHDEEMFIDPKYANNLLGVCLASEELGNTFSGLDTFGKEPCFSMRGEQKKRSLICPFYSICPRKESLRKLQNANVVFLNVYSLFWAKTHPLINRGRINLFEYLVDYMDLVIFDEADDIQTKLDMVLNKSEDVNEVLIKNNEAFNLIQQKNLKSSSMQNYSDLTISFTLAMNCLQIMTSILENYQSVSDKIARLRNGQWFTASIIAQELKGIPDTLQEELKNYSDRINDNFDSIRIGFHMGDEDREKSIENLRYKYGLDESWQYVLEFEFALIFFERAFFETQYAFQEVATESLELNFELSDIFRKPDDHLLALLPSSPTNNRFGFIYDSIQEDGQKNERKRLQIFRQFAIGRSAMLDLPYMKLGENGEPLGPHTLLLSGSSYAEGSSAHHIYRPVNYILKAPEKVQKFLANMTLKAEKTNITISGSKNKKRVLEQLVTEASPYFKNALSREGRLLVIVNSYEQTKVVQKVAMKELHEPMYRVISDGATSEDYTIYRSQLNQANKYNFRSLVAPASIIARGHNIVDTNGHSLFSTLFFLVRPMDKPKQIDQIVAMMNGEIYKMASKFTQTPFATAEIKQITSLKKRAFKFWHIAMQDYYSLEQTHPILKKNIVVSRIVLMMQIIGRLLRIQNYEAEPPVVILLDEAFEGATPSSFNLYHEIEKYLVDSMEHSQYGPIMKLLYEPFLKAIEGGKVLV